MGLLDIFSSIRERADRFLSEKNVVTDFLGKVEEKTGIKKKILAVGEFWFGSGRFRFVLHSPEESVNPPMNRTASFAQTRTCLVQHPCRR